MRLRQANARLREANARLAAEVDSARRDNAALRARVEELTPAVAELRVRLERNANRAMRPDGSTVARMLRLAVPLLLPFVGVVVVSRSPLRHSVQGVVWAILAVSLTTAAGVVFDFSIRRWRDLCTVQPVPVTSVAPAALSIGALAILLTFTSVALPGGGFPWFGTLLVWAAIVGGMPGAFVMFGVRQALASYRPRTQASHTHDLLRFRSIVQRQLTALGTLVALATLALGASLRAADEASALPPEGVFIFGAFGSLGVAAIYLPARDALRDSGQQLVNEMFPLLDDNLEAAMVLQAAENRQRMQSVLGVDKTILSELHDNIAILAPLIASGVELFL